MRTLTVPARRFGALAMLTLASGGLMMAGGYLFHTTGWHTAGLVMLPSGPIISIAFALLPSATRSHGELPKTQRKGRTRQVRAIAVVLVGLPWPGADKPLQSQIGAFALTMLAGAIMALGGYAAAAWNWLLAPPSVLAGGVTIAAAFLVATTDLQRSHSPSGVS